MNGRTLALGAAAGLAAAGALAARSRSAGSRALSPPDPAALVARLNADATIAAWLRTNTYGETLDDSWMWGGCLVFGEALVAAHPQLVLHGVGYALDLDDAEEGSYEHVVALDPATGLYWDARGSHAHDTLLGDYVLKPMFRTTMGETVIVPFDHERNCAIPWDAAIVARAVALARGAPGGSRAVARIPGRIAIESGGDAFLWRKVGVNIAPEESDYEVARDATGDIVGASTFGWKTEDGLGDGEEHEVATFSVGVLPRARRRGIARRLVKRILAAHPGTEFNVWVVSPHMAALLEDLGFDAEGREWSPDAPHMTFHTPTRAEAKRKRKVLFEREVRAAAQASRPRPPLQPATYFATHKGPVTLEHLNLSEDLLAEARADRLRYAADPAARRARIAELLSERSIIIPSRSRLAMSDKGQIVLKVDPQGRDETRSERSNRLARKP